MIGLSKSSLVNPMARNIERAGARDGPSVRALLAHLSPFLVIPGV